MSIKEAGREKVAPRELVLEWLRSRIRELEEELEVLRSILSLLESGGPVYPGEKVEEVRVGRRRVARLLKGEGYVRVVFDRAMPMPDEIREYLKSVEEEIRASQARSGAQEGDLARLAVREAGQGVVEIRYDNLHTTIEILKAKAALKYASEALYQILKAQEKLEGQ